MTLIVGWRPFPWTCHMCDSQDITIRPQNKENDLQEIKVTCNKCKTEVFTSGGVINIDKETKTWRDATPEELAIVRSKLIVVD